MSSDQEPVSDDEVRQWMLLRCGRGMAGLGLRDQRRLLTALAAARAELAEMEPLRPLLETLLETATTELVCRTSGEPMRAGQQTCAAHDGAELWCRYDSRLRPATAENERAEG